MKTSASRRALLRAFGSAAATGLAAPWAVNLTAIRAAAAEVPGDDYRALVCINMDGGNDHGNTLIPTDDASYGAYAKARLGLAIPQSALVRLNTPSTDRQVGLPPALAALKPLYDRKRVAVLANVGSLIEPTTLADYKAGRAHLPGAIGSHSDQQALWKTFHGDLAARPGWGGRIGDLLASQNTNPLFTAVTPLRYESGMFLNGLQVGKINIEAGAGTIPEVYGVDSVYGSKVAGAQLREMMTRNSANLIARHHGKIAGRVLEVSAAYNRAVSAAQVMTPFPDTGFAAQLRTVARVIAARKELGMRRQIFQVGLGSFDDHSTVKTSHAPRLEEMAKGMAAFHDAMEELGLGNQVTAFTTSEFGRTLDANSGGSDGSDHGWGGHHFVMGGAVKGGDVYGRFPEIRVGGPDDVYRGVLLPTTSWDQYAATLAAWFGLSAAQIAEVIPGLANFDDANLGFMAT